MHTLRQWLIDFVVHARELFGRGRLRSRITEEMQTHVAMREDQLVRSGIPPAEARKRARREFGNVAALRDSASDLWRYGSLERLVQDVRYGIRTLLRAPGFTAVSIAVLALGIGLNTTIFTVANTYLLRPLPAVHPRELVRVCSNRFSGTHLRSFVEYRARNSTLTALIGFNLVSVGLRLDRETEQSFGETVSGDYFSVLGIPVALGRPIGSDDDRPDALPVVVVAHDFWQRRLGAGHDAIGRSLMLNDRAFTIVGVARADFPGMMPPIHGSFWLPLSADRYLRPGVDENDRLNRSLHMLGRLKPGVTRAQAQSDLDTIGRQLRAAARQPDTGPAISVYNATTLHPEIAPPVMAFASFLLVMVGLVLLIVCVNLANLLLARSATRTVELAIRQSIGAGRGRLVRQLLTESLLLAVAGASVALAITCWCARLLTGLSISGGPVPVAFNLVVDWRVVGFSTIAAIVATIVFGTAPALAASKVDLLSALKGVAGPDRRHSRVRARFLIAQVALSVLLLTAAGLTMLAFKTARSIDRGFDGSHVLTASIDLESRGYNAAHGREFMNTLTERLRATPGIRAVNMVDVVPLTLSNSIGFFLRETDPVPTPTQQPPTPQVFLNGVGPGHFDTLGIQLLQGRDFTPRDDDSAPPVAIVNETFARRFFPGQTALGRRLRPAASPNDPRAALEIIGVVRDSKYVTIGEEPRPFLYRPLGQAYTPQITMLVRAAGPPGSVLPSVNAVMRALDPGLPIFNVAPMDDATVISLLPAQIAGWLLAALGVLALILSALGTYGVLSFLVRSRAREIAIRLAIGSTPRAVASIVVGQAVKWTAIGSVVGLGLAVLLTRFLSAYLYGVSPTSPLVLGGAVTLMACVACTAALAPAIRAARQNPLEALRNL
jgi:predicted permease